ncbi:MAG: hypothetical protein WCS03_13665 [Bacteroidota bacterium]
MESISIMNRSAVSVEKKVRTDFNRVKRSSEKTKSSPAIDNLIAEGGENFFHYLKGLGLANEPNMMVLSSKHHYYYDNSDLEGVTTLIIMKKLNMIKHFDSFLHTVCDALSPVTNFIGCFSDRKTQQEIGLHTRIYKRFINFLDSRTDVEIDKKDVSRLLESRGYKVIDMTEINGLTYFRTQNLGLSA